MSGRITKSKVMGCIQGVALGDAYGAPYEGGVLERALWKFIQLFSKDILFTDDTQTTLDVIHSMIERKDICPDDIALKMSTSYTWLKGYGKNTAGILKKIAAGGHWSDLNESVFDGGSFGNGAAIRACPVGLFFSPQLSTNKAKFKAVSRDVAAITHSHELGVHGAYIYALTVASVVNGVGALDILDGLKQESTGSAFYSKIDVAQSWLSSGQNVKISIIRKQLGNGMSALESVVTAIYMAFSHLEQPMQPLINECIKLKGDTDSIASMACGIWGAHNGHDEIPNELFARIEGTSAIISSANKLFDLIEEKTIV